MFLLISFTTSYSFYDGLLMFMYHFVTKIYLHLLPILFFGSEMKLGPIWSILVIAEFLIHQNRDLGVIYHSKFYFCVRNIHKHHLYAVPTS